MADLIDTALLQRIAQLARLGVSPDEAEALANDVAAILAHFEALAAVDIDDAPEWNGLLANPPAPADDSVSLWPQPHESLLALSAHTEDGFLVVPSILEAAPPSDARATEAESSESEAEPSNTEPSDEDAV